ncbi:MAG: hypothetical protein AAFU85_12505 [Planctomycetota bacterium]
MNPEDDPLDELPDGLKEIVDGIVKDAVPDDLADAVRARLDGQLNSRPTAAKPRLSRAMLGIVMMAATILAIAFLVTATWDRPADVDDDHPFRSAAVTRSSTHGPSLWAYHRAAIDSHDQLDRLLSEHAAVMLNSDHALASQTNFLSTAHYLEE